MDAHLMMLILLDCFQNKLTVSSIHDSFGTHPSDVDRLNQVLHAFFI